ncbi:dihydropteroate synthase [Pigmentiphaga sp. NML080357]|uniref:dihydropteroate synthase n=1 Tax=Pigmentiphaga sp. NML080357 TaxID=2008675 RepID=UPI000B41C0CA|nr:dihydropteroate synthase [Pigmentiphaga sp. NML080357]OVZ58888.1 dihydropteroate synthase [Pigmentiphaga sp. NML080357]
MGIINVTPDSFSDGGKNLALDAGIAHARQLIAEGADMLDIGGESTRPGAEPVSLGDELARLLPLIEALRDCGVPLSVDTFKPAVMRAVLDAGADMINDIYGFRQPGAVEAVARGTAGLCVMHMQGEPRTMQQAPVYADVVGDVAAFLREQAERLLAAGVAPERICVDPGFGFGKTTAHNYALMRSLPTIGALGYPLLIGVSRKTMIGAVTGKPVGERVAGSVAAALAAVDRGAAIVRVHDVAATVDALKVWRAVQAWEE